MSTQIVAYIILAIIIALALVVQRLLAHWRRFRRAGTPEWAAMAFLEGRRYAEELAGDRDENLRRAIACCETALTVFTPEEFPEQWGMTQDALGSAYRALVLRGDAEAAPQAITCTEAALRVYTRGRFPRDWAVIQVSLGLVYRSLGPIGRPEAIPEAIAHYEAALGVLTEKEHPQDWAGLQINLGNAYLELTTGDRAANIRQAAAHYEASLRVHTRETSPHNWASIQLSLGNAFTHGDAPGVRGDNLRQALVHYEAALSEWGKPGSPLPWPALAMANMAEVYADKDMPGDRCANLQEGSRLLEQALQMLPESAFPDDHARMQEALADAAARREAGCPD